MCYIYINTNYFREILKYLGITSATDFENA